MSYEEQKSQQYDEAFRLFLQHTDQKSTLLEWLDSLLDTLPAGGHLVDAGAGDGTLTVKLAPRFDSVTVIEPNTTFCAQFGKKLPDAQVIAKTMEEAFASESRLEADFLVCSHLLYHVNDWLGTLRLMLSHLTAERGVLVLVLQSVSNDCHRLVEHFRLKLQSETETRSLAHLAAKFLQTDRTSHKVSIETIPSFVQVSDLETACKVAEFFLHNPLIERDHDVDRDFLRDYLQQHLFDDVGRVYRFSVHQDVLLIQAPKVTL